MSQPEVIEGFTYDSLRLQSTFDNCGLLNLSDPERLQNAISRLKEQHIYFLQELNHQNSLTKNVPNEILATIFILSCQPPSDHWQKFTLAGVSSQWRRVAFATPQLWTLFCEEVNNYTVRRIAFLLQFYLRHSSYNLGLTIKLNFSDLLVINYRADNNYPQTHWDVAHNYYGLGWSRGMDAPLDPVRNLIFCEYPEKIKCLRLIHPPKEWVDISMPAHGERFKLLEDFHLSWQDQMVTYVKELTKPFDVTNFPQLQRLSLYNLPVMHTYSASTPCFVPNINTITELRLSQMDYHLCLNVVFSCHNLRLASCVGLSFCGTSDTTLPPTDDGAQMNYLEILEWSFPKHHTTDFDADSLPPIRNSPLLQTIVIRSAFDCLWCPIPALDTFLKHLPPSCKSLTLGMENAHDSYKQPEAKKLREYLPFIPSTVSCITFDAQCIILASSIISELDFYMPVNASITIMVSYDRISCDGMDFKQTHFVYVMRKRLELLGIGAAKFSLTYQKDCGEIDWDVGVQRKLKALVDRGLNFEIKEDGSVVDWL